MSRFYNFFFNLVLTRFYVEKYNVESLAYKLAVFDVTAAHARKAVAPTHAPTVQHWKDEKRKREAIVHFVDNINIGRRATRAGAKTRLFSGFTLIIIRFLLLFSSQSAIVYLYNVLVAIRWK